MKEIKTVKDLKDFIGKAYQNTNYFDSQAEVEELKKHVSEKEIIAGLQKEIRHRKEQEHLCQREVAKVESQFGETATGLLEEALNYVTHYYRRGQYVVFWSKWDDLYRVGEVRKLTKKGYVIFNGVKIGINEDVPFTNVICHARSVNKFFDMKLKEDKVKR